MRRLLHLGTGQPRVRLVFNCCTPPRAALIQARSARAAFVLRTTRSLHASTRDSVGFRMRRWLVPVVHSSRMGQQCCLNTNRYHRVTWVRIGGVGETSSACLVSFTVMMMSGDTPRCTARKHACVVHTCAVVQSLARALRCGRVATAATQVQACDSSDMSNCETLDCGIVLRA